MNIDKAIKSKADINCSTLKERNKCIAILYSHNCYNSRPLLDDRLVLNILSAKKFNCGIMVLGDIYPAISGADFIKNNPTLTKTTNYENA